MTPSTLAAVFEAGDANGNLSAEQLQQQLPEISQRVDLAIFDADRAWEAVTNRLSEHISLGRGVPTWIPCEWPEDFVAPTEKNPNPLELECYTHLGFDRFWNRDEGKEVWGLVLRTGEGRTIDFYRAHPSARIHALAYALPLLNAFVSEAGSVLDEAGEAHGHILQINELREVGE